MTDYRLIIDELTDTIERLSRYRDKCKYMIRVQKMEKFNKFYKSFNCEKINDDTYRMISKKINNFTMVLDKDDLDSFNATYCTSCFFCKQFYEHHYIDMSQFNFYRSLYLNEWIKFGDDNNE